MNDTTPKAGSGSAATSSDPEVDGAVIWAAVDAEKKRRGTSPAENVTNDERAHALTFGFGFFNGARWMEKHLRAALTDQEGTGTPKLTRENARDLVDDALARIEESRCGEGGVDLMQLTAAGRIIAVAENIADFLATKEGKNG
jgi:hypothetical protein